jgi:hypothetical protein
MPKDVGLSIQKADFLSFVTFLAKIGVDIIACNEHKEPALVWLVDSPLLQSQLCPTATGCTCGGFQVVEHSIVRGKVLKTFKNQTYYDVLIFVQNSEASCWSPPTCFDVIKKAFK